MSNCCNIFANDYYYHLKREIFYGQEGKRHPNHGKRQPGSRQSKLADGGAVNYEPNSFNGLVEDPSVKEPPLKISDDVDRYSHRECNDGYTQAGNLFRLMKPDQKNQLIQNIVNAMKNGAERNPGTTNSALL